LHLPRLEGDHELLGHEHLLAGPRVAGLSGASSLHLEDAEIADSDAALLGQRVQDGVEYLLDDLAGLQLAHAQVFGDRPDDLSLGHGGVLLDRSRGRGSVRASRA
jgi:hypothetical protein